MEALKLPGSDSLEVGRVSPLLTPTGKSFRFVRACGRARRGEAVWASERRFDREARAVLRQMFSFSAAVAKPCRLSMRLSAVNL